MEIVYGLIQGNWEIYLFILFFLPSHLKAKVFKFTKIHPNIHTWPKSKCAAEINNSPTFRLCVLFMWNPVAFKSRRVAEVSRRDSRMDALFAECVKKKKKKNGGALKNTNALT